jgi:ceramide glucosyltransferase
LFENLESTFHQEYRNFEIIFSVANEYDQALPVVQALLEKYPHSDARVIVGTDKPSNIPQVLLTDMRTRRGGGWGKPQSQ